MAQAPGRDWLAVQHVRTSLARKSVYGSLWSIIGRVGNQAIRVGSMVLLARMLTPADFGVVGMVLAIVGVAFVLQDLGFSSSSISKEEITDGQVSNLFWLNAGVGILAMLLLMALAPALESFYRDPRVLETTVALAANFALGGLSTQHRALLVRAMAFQTLAAINIAASLVTAFSSVLLATLGAAHWALILGVLLGTLVSTIGVWWCCDWRPGRPQRGLGMRSMVTLGGTLALYSLLSYVARNLHGIVIGRLWGPADAGIYGRAATVSQLLFTNLVSPVGQVAPAAMSRLGAEPEKFSDFYYKACTLVTLAAAPLMFVGVALPADFVIALLGEQWLPAVPLLLILSLGLLPQALVQTTGWVFLTKDRSADMVRWGCWGWIVMIAATLLGARWGMTGIAVALTASAWLLVIPTMTWAFTDTALTLLGVARAMAAPVAAAAIAGPIAVFVLAVQEIQGPWMRLMAGCGIFAVVYGALLLTVLDQRPLLNELVGLLRQEAGARGASARNKGAGLATPKSPAFN